MAAGLASWPTPAVLRQLRALAEADPSLREPVTWVPVTAQLLALARRSGSLHLPRRPLPGVVTETVVVPAAQGRPSVPVEVHRPEAGITAPAAALLWIHGGGYVMGDAAGADDSCAEVVTTFGVPVLSVDYRLAPAHPFPAPLDDCHAALCWLLEHADELGVDPTRVVVGGDSAGGGLAAALAQRATDEGLAVAFQLLLYPMLDDRTVLRSARLDEWTLMWTPPSNRYGWASYLQAEPGVGSPPPYAAPARRTDLSGLPPAWIGVGDVDLFHAEDVDYANRLRAAGVECELYVAKGMPHAVDRHDSSPVSAGFNASKLEALRRAFFD